MSDEIPVVPYFALENVAHLVYELPGQREGEME